MHQSSFLFDCGTSCTPPPCTPLHCTGWDPEAYTQTSSSELFKPASVCNDAGSIGGLHLPSTDEQSDGASSRTAISKVRSYADRGLSPAQDNNQPIVLCRTHPAASSSSLPHADSECLLGLSLPDVSTWGYASHPHWSQYRKGSQPSPDSSKTPASPSAVLAGWAVCGAKACTYVTEGLGAGFAQLIGSDEIGSTERAPIELKLNGEQVGGI